MPKLKVICSQCGSSILRWPNHPVTKTPLKNFYCDNVCKGTWQREKREAMGFTKEWLFNEYFVLKKSANQIAQEIGRNSKRVWEWMRDYGFEMRTRGHDTSHLPKDGRSFRGKKHTTATKKRLKEIAIADGRLPYKPEVGSYMIGRSGKDHPSWKGGLTPERQAVYCSPEWCESVKVVWSRDNAICRRCGAHHNDEKNRGNFHIHHIISFQVREFRTDPNNLILVCKPCHKWIHSKNNLTKEFIQEI